MGLVEWERHEPGHFSAALFDHRKSIRITCIVTFPEEICHRHANMRWRGGVQAYTNTGRETESAYSVAQ